MNNNKQVCMDAISSSTRRWRMIHWASVSPFAAHTTTTSATIKPSTRTLEQPEQHRFASDKRQWQSRGNDHDVQLATNERTDSTKHFLHILHYYYFIIMYRLV